MAKVHTPAVAPVMAPKTLLTLDELGIEEIEPGIVEDTHRNRVTLRESGYQWSMMVDTHEEPAPDAVPRIRVVTAEDAYRFAEEHRERKQEILADPEDAWSDYVSPLEFSFSSPVPFWVKASAAKWKQAIEKGKDPDKLQSFWLPVRCHAIKSDGTRCWHWAGTSTQQRDTGYCRVHLNASGIKHEAYVQAARTKLAQAAPAAADTVEELAMGAQQEAVRLKAATEVLDRVGVRGGVEITSETTVKHEINASETVKDRLAKLREARETRMTQVPVSSLGSGTETVDAEVLDS